MKKDRPRMIVNRIPKLRHGWLTVRHANGNLEYVRLCPCCTKEPPKGA